MTKWWGNSIELGGLEALEQSGLCTDEEMTTKPFRGNDYQALFLRWE